MASPVKVEICMGTTCHIFGASDLHRIEELLPESLKGSVDISGSPCLDACKNGNYGKAPFVKVNGKLHSKVDVHSLLEAILKEAGEAKP